MTDTPYALPESPIPPHRLSAERLLASAGAIRSFASAYLDVLDDDVSDAERTKLAAAADLCDRVLDYFT
jgi:hypothetical protein